MSTAMPPRGAITDTLIAHLETAEVLVGDGVRPPAAGWAGGQPGQGLFVASVLVATLDGVPNDRDPLAGRHSSWRLIYRLSVAGGTRKQADDTADIIRAHTLEFPHGSTAAAIAEGWRCNDVVFARQAPVEPQTPTDAPTWVVADQVELWVSRSRTA